MGTSKEVIRIENGKEIKRYKSAQEVANELGLLKSTICRRCKTGKEHNGIILKYSGNTNKINNNHIELPVKCPYCERHFSTYNGLCKHVIREKAHGEISKEQLLIDYAYNGIRPTCKCGCGEYTEITYNGGAHFADYCFGHASRIHNNWGHNEKAKERSAETRKEQYKNGTRIQWNKGKSWDETYTISERNKLLKILKNKERKNKIRAKLKGIPKSEEQKKKLREIFNTEEYKNKSRNTLLKRLNSGQFFISSKEETDFINEFIKPLNIEFITQYYIKDIHQYCDVFIPNKKLIIEFNGTYWHADPRKYSENNLTSYQKERVEKDNEKKKWADEHGFKLLTIWEEDYKKDKKLVLNEIKKAL